MKYLIYILLIISLATIWGNVRIEKAIQKTNSLIDEVIIEQIRIRHLYELIYKEFYVTRKYVEENL